MELGKPSSYLTLTEGTRVFACGGKEVGRVTEVVAAVEQDIFEGIVFSAHHGLGHDRFAEAAEIASIHEQGVVLILDEAACSELGPRA